MYQNLSKWCTTTKKAPDARTGNGWQPKFDFEASPWCTGFNEVQWWHHPFVLHHTILHYTTLVHTCSEACSPLLKQLVDLVVSSVQTPGIADMPLIGAERARNDLPIGCRALQFLLDPFLFCSPHVLGATAWVQGCMKWDEWAKWIWCFTVLPSFTILSYVFHIWVGLCSFCLDPQHSLGSLSASFRTPSLQHIAAACPTWSWSSHLSSSGHQLLSNWLPEGCSAGRRCCV